MMTLVQKLRVLGGAAGGPNVHDDAADRINELETAAVHPLSNPNLISRVARLEDALRYWSGYDDIDFAVQQAKARGELSPPNSGELSISEWQSIETAPKDGTVILLGCPPVGAMKDPRSRRVYEGRWHDAQKTFTSVNGFLLLSVATHWMPLPEPPNCGRAEHKP